MKTTPIRNFRIDDKVWKPAKSAADNLGISVTFVVTTALKAFSREPSIVLGEPEELRMPKRFQKKAEELNAVITQALQKKNR